MQGRRRSHHLICSVLSKSRLPLSRWPVILTHRQLPFPDLSYYYPPISRSTYTWYVIVVGISAYLALRRSCCAAESPDCVTAGSRRTDLPDIRTSDIDQHKDASTGVWVTFRDGVYDVTDFVAEHPGDKKILLAAGGAVDGFWDFYAIHHTAHVYEQLEQLRIGNLHPDDATKTPASGTDNSKAFSNEPRRSPVLRVHSTRPFNAESPAELLVDDFITPTELFYVRNHLPVPPTVDSVTVDGVGLRTSIGLSVSEMKTRFEVVTVTATLQCAGNRRREMDGFRSVKGLQWGSAAIGNASWTGVRLSDVLAYAGVREEDVEHIIFQGGDTDAEGTPYEASIPAATAMDPRKDVLLAFEMNGEPLSRDHGAPCRVIVPGLIGARQVKWLRRITASRSVSDSHWQRADYKVVPTSFDWTTDDISKVTPIYEYPVQSAICEPADGSSLDADEDTVVVRGYSWSGGGRGILGVDVSLDGGTTWRAAKLTQTSQDVYRQWAWTLFEVEAPIPSDRRGRKLDVVCRAVDSEHNSQPDKVADIWNQRGLLHNAYPRVTVHVPATR